MRRPLAAGCAAVLTAGLLSGGGALAADAASLTTGSAFPYGKYLADSEGRSLYLFTADENGKSACTGACAEAWPPLTTKGKPELGKTLDKSLLGTVKRKDGRTQVTFGGWPLYRHAKDKEKGDAKGHDVHGFGGEWYLVGHDGDRVEETKAADKKKPK